MRPEWLRTKLPAGKNYNEIKSILRQQRLFTVCEEALCPNIGECFEARTATFLILGDTCTRQCGFCAVKKGSPPEVNKEEPFRVATAVKEMRLQYAVITSVTRDDLSDNGATAYAQTIRCIREGIKTCKVEVLIPDFGGSFELLQVVLNAVPDVLNHNMETVPRLYSQVRSMSDYHVSLEVLRHTLKYMPGVTTKSGIMLGLGEKWDEVISVMRDIRDTGCDILTIGQYLKPGKNALPIQRYYTPEEFCLLKWEGKRMGFKHVESGPLVRSSYHAKMQSGTVLTC
ncbi:MAG: lipoyl synthase [Candidatus Brocadiaceae bacterium]|nr:lipoyl synthase [Candidatus Brocadiaceae bacterium]